MHPSHLLPGLLLVAASPAMATDAAHGKQLVDAHCYSCHGTGVYTRPDRKVGSLEALHKQVGRCQLSQGLRWFDEDIADVTAYLNGSFYKFK